LASPELPGSASTATGAYSWLGGVTGDLSQWGRPPSFRGLLESGRARHYF
jgi:hypothetical protein